MSTKNSGDFEDIDEAEEEALLKSDDEFDAAAKAKVAIISNLLPPVAGDDDSLMNEATQLEDYDSNAGISPEDNKLEDEIIISDDDDEENELDETDKILVEYKAVLKELEKNQYAYDKYVRLCELSHATDDLDYIRNAYNMFANIYPLAPELWLKYLKIEASVALSNKEIEKVEELFRCALRDYYSIDVALEYASLAKRATDSEHIWNELLGTYGLHCMKGQVFFKEYRQFISSQTISAEEKQTIYIQSFLRELKYPLHNMEESYIEFKVFYEKNKTQLSHQIDWEQLDRNYFKAKEHLLKILPFEQQLETLERKMYRERANVYTNYIKDTDKFLDENVLQTVYERMVAECCLNADCWLTYINFIDYRDEFGRPEELQDLPIFQQEAIDVNNRALRNCTWSEKLYIRRIHLLEKLEKTREEIQEVLESSLSAGFQTAEPAVAIWLEYLTYLRRHTDWENEGECDILRKNFNLAWTILGQQWGVLADCNCEILQFWGRLEYGPLQDAKRGKELWTTVMASSDNATKSGLWVEFTQMEMRRDLDSTRKLYRKALHTSGLDNPLVIASVWQRFERCNGNIKTLLSCIKECENFLQEFVANTKSMKPAATVANSKSVKPGATASTTSKSTKRKSSTPFDEVQEKKSKAVEKFDSSANVTAISKQKHQDSVFKEHENQTIDLTKDHLRIFLSNLDYNLSEDDIRSGFPELNIVNVDLIRSANGRSRGFGYLELESALEVDKALALDRRSLNGRPIYISSVLRDKEKRQKFKYSDEVEPRKLFLKSLPNDVTKEELEKMYMPFGKLKDVRLVYHKSGKFKNIAYVEYENEHGVGKAVISTDQMELRGHTISVAISAPPPKPSAAPPINTKKLLGIGTKRTKVYDQKPRMSLIPNVVRKKLSSDIVSPLKTVTASPAQTTNGATSTKTNDDFRKLLQKS